MCFKCVSLSKVNHHHCIFTKCFDICQFRVRFVHDLTQLYTTWPSLEHDLLDGIFLLHVRRCKLNIMMQKTEYACLFLFPPNCRVLICKGKQVGSSHEIFQSILTEVSGISMPILHYLSGGTHFLI